MHTREGPWLDLLELRSSTNMWGAESAGLSISFATGTLLDCDDGWLLTSGGLQPLRVLLWVFRFNF